jgi:predicted SAM-dependent methyltransferase
MWSFRSTKLNRVAKTSMTTESFAKLPSSEHPGHRLHIGCGDKPLTGWTNIDVKDGIGADVVLDVRNGLPFANVDFIFAEHFIEHLELHDAVEFLRACNRALHGGGILRLTTPNLDWVMLSHYRYGRWLNADDSVDDCLATNMAFHGWGHRFLYNFCTLRLLLEIAGFESVWQLAYGESTHPELRGIEQHERSPDWPGLPHVVVIEATGRSAEEPLSKRFIDYLTIESTR